MPPACRLSLRPRGRRTPLLVDILVWQADEAGSVLATHAHEPRYVDDSLAGRPVTDNAGVEISGKDVNGNLHYVFVPQASSAAVSASSSAKFGSWTSQAADNR